MSKRRREGERERDVLFDDRFEWHACTSVHLWVEILLDRLKLGRNKKIWKEKEGEKERRTSAQRRRREDERRNEPLNLFDVRVLHLSVRRLMFMKKHYVFLIKK